MVTFKELISRVQDFYSFNRQELIGLTLAVIVTAFVFSFRDWGREQFELAYGLKNLLLVAVVASLSFFFRISCQKIYGLNEGYLAEFKVWWTGLVIALVLAFLTAGRFPVVLIGGMAASFMVRQRLGEFRYGFSYKINGIIALWGVIGNLILAILLAVGSYFFPASYFFQKGLILNLVMAVGSILPFPQLDGLNLFFGSRGYYVTAFAAIILFAALLLSKTKWGLITALVIALITGLFYLLISSQR